MKPRRNVADPVKLAMMGAAKLPASDTNAIRAIYAGAAGGLRFGRGDGARHWRSLADAFNVAEGLADVGICSDKGSRARIAAAHHALGELHERHQRTGSWTCRAAELSAFDDALWLHGAQLGFCSLSEFERAVRLVRDRTQQALCGNVARGVQVLEQRA